MLRHDSFPIARTDDGVFVRTALDPADRVPVAGWFPGERVYYERVSRHQVHEQILTERSAEVADEMANGFTRRHPAMAAHTGVARWQKVAAAAFCLALLAALGLGAGPVVVILVGVVFSVGMLFKALLAVLSFGSDRASPVLPELADDQLPTYTILIPAYQEEAVIGETVRWIAGMDYPADKLEVLVLVERRDIATQAAVRAVNPPPFVRIVQLPPGKPQTKPRSCNLGLMLARGDLVVIFDAEDRPERDQLRKVAAQFAAGGDKLACVQARLNYYNAARNPLTRMFGLEYAFWFDLMLVGLDRLRLPIPLGGTSNHIRTDVLRTVGGWDAWNVTEDADLGLRFASAGYTVEVSQSTTWEECPARPWAWIRQRTRWLKGYLLTLLVHTRNPVDATRRFGRLGMVSLVGIVAGTPVVSMLWPFAFVFGLAASRPAHIAAAMMWSATGVMMSGWLVAAYRRRAAWAMAVLVPWYWLMHAFAGWRGLLQLLRSPYSWEKTSHG
jgi:cellulose synthase/poly-beta-1,6-N-acetylglucosamine synthase-like glycosyltransferase